MTIRLACATAAVLTAMGCAMGCAHAQSYPDKPIHIISGTQVGTSGDLAGRMLAQKLTAQLGQPVVFESRPGANGQIAANYLKTLPPDGTNILYTASSTVVTGPLMSRNVGFDTFKDFTPISQAVGAPLYLVANSELGVDTTAGLVEYAKKNPGQLNYGSVGRGSVFHFQGEAMKVACSRCRQMSRRRQRCVLITEKRRVPTSSGVRSDVWLRTEAVAYRIPLRRNIEGRKIRSNDPGIRGTSA